MTRHDYQLRAREFALMGERNPAAKLTADIVRTIRARHVPHSRQHSMPAIARDMALPLPTVRDVVEYRTWAHIE